MRLFAPKHKLFLQKIALLFYFSQNYSIFALDFAAKPIGE